MKGIQLSIEERSYLQRLLKEHRDYYQTLAGSAKCSPRNRELCVLIETLWLKLQ